jgi:MerR family transcriptional regulator, light-induced transcriptional regulator
MVYIRSKKVKGIDYAYLVKSVWNTRKNTSNQQTIKYLGKASDIKIGDIPKEYNNDPKILAFISSYSKDRQEKDSLITKIQEEIFKFLVGCNVKGLVTIYEKHRRLIELSSFYDKLMKPVMYNIGDLWEQGKLDVATEHVCSNMTNNLIKSINKRIDKATLNFKYKILICTPEGELHNLACNMIESLLLSKGFKIYNISPSVPSDSIISYVKKVEPDIILISVTLEENISAVQRLINEIRSKFHIPMVVGGAATNQIPLGSISDVIIMQNGSLSELLKLINSVFSNR